MSEADFVPPAVRAEVYERDGGCCRVCGQFARTPGLHHILFRSQGGLDTPSNLITIGWTPEHDCHLRFAHGPRALALRPVLLQVAQTPGITAFQLMRWSSMSNAPTIEETIAAFWAKVSVGGPDECWEWNGARTKPVGGQSSGYGFLQARRIKNGPIRAHVFSFMLANDRWPKQHVLHQCDNPPCVNPAHLYEGDQAQNMADRAARKPRHGAANPAAKHGGLVDEIRSRIASGETQAQVARDLHLSSGVLSRIARGINYPQGAS